MDAFISPNPKNATHRSSESAQGRCFRDTLAKARSSLDISSYPNDQSAEKRQVWLWASETQAAERTFTRTQAPKNHNEGP